MSSLPKFLFLIDMTVPAKKFYIDGPLWMTRPSLTAGSWLTFRCFQSQWQHPRLSGRGESSVWSWSKAVRNHWRPIGGRQIDESQELVHWDSTTDQRIIEIRRGERRQRSTASLQREVEWLPLRQSWTSDQGVRCEADASHQAEVSVIKLFRSD